MFCSVAFFLCWLYIDPVEKIEIFKIDPIKTLVGAGFPGDCLRCCVIYQTKIF